MTHPNKVALVTGAGTGIGRSVAIALLNEGYRVTLTGRRREPLEDTAQLAGVGYARQVVIPTDVSNPDDVERALAHWTTPDLPTEWD